MWQVQEGNHSPQSNIDAKNGGAIPPLFHRLHRMVLKLAQG
jgi:hypothetical protein